MLLPGVLLRRLQGKVASKCGPAFLSPPQQRPLMLRYSYSSSPGISIARLCFDLGLQFSHLGFAAADSPGPIK